MRRRFSKDKDYVYSLLDDLLSSIKTFVFTFQAIALQVDYCRSSGITTGQRYLDEPHSLVKIIDGIKLKA